MCYEYCLALVNSFWISLLRTWKCSIHFLHFSVPTMVFFVYQYLSKKTTTWQRSYKTHIYSHQLEPSSDLHRNFHSFRLMRHCKYFGNELKRPWDSYNHSQYYAWICGFCGKTSFMSSSRILAFARSLSFFRFILLFWNQTLTCLSDSWSLHEISQRFCRVI